MLSKLKRQSWLARVGHHEFLTLLLIAVIGGGTWGFIELSDEVIEGDTTSIDESILLSMRTPGDLSDPVGPGWLEELGRDFTALGGVGVLSALSLAVAGYLLLSHHYRTTLLLAAAVIGALVVSTALKFGFDRPRPELVPHGSIVYTASFPSGHSMMAATVYLTLAALLARTQNRRRIKAYLLIVGITLSVLVGISRVYLGVHWPTDVLAGWTAGAVWALLIWLVARYLQRRGKIEPEEMEAP